MGKFLSEPRFAILGTVARSGRPHLTVMWYDLRGEEVMFNTARGRHKVRNLERDPRCSLVVADGYRYVRLDGKVTRIVDDHAEALRDIVDLAKRYHGPERGARMKSLFARQERITYYVAIERVYANGL